MKTNYWILKLLVAGCCTGGALAQDKAPAPPTGAELRSRHEPPQQAYEDCKGKKAGEVVQHTTREGKVAATCEESPKGLVARPKQPRGGPADMPTK